MPHPKPVLEDIISGLKIQAEAILQENREFLNELRKDLKVKKDSSPNLLLLLDGLCGAAKESGPLEKLMLFEKLHSACAITGLIEDLDLKKINDEEQHVLMFLLGRACGELEKHNPKIIPSKLYADFFHSLKSKWAIEKKWEGREPEDLISEHIWVIENWGMDRWPLYTKIEDKKDYLDYEVVTTAVPPEPLFFALFVKFPNYDYDIFSWEEFNAFKYELIFKNGEVSKRIKTYWETEPFGNKKSKIITLEYNYLSKTEQVVEIRTYDNGKLPYFPGSEEGQVDGTITKKYTG